MSIVGNNTIGGSQQFHAGPIGIKFTAPAEAGDITKMTIYALCSDGSCALGAAIYADSSGAPGSRLAVDSGDATVNSPTPAWYDINISYTFAANEVLWLFFWGGDSASFSMHYDTGGTAQTYYASSGGYETWPNPWVSTSNLDRTGSVYATYTPASAALAPFSARRMIGVIHSQG